MAKLAYLLAVLGTQCCCREADDPEDLSHVANEFRQVSQPSLEISACISGVQFNLRDSTLRTQVSPDRQEAKAPKLLLEFIDGVREDIGTILHVTPYGIHKVAPVRPLSMQHFLQKSLSRTLEETKMQYIDIRYAPSSSSYFLRDLEQESQSYFRVDGSHSLTAKQTISICDSLVIVQAVRNT